MIIQQTAAYSINFFWKKEKKKKLFQMEKISKKYSF